MPAQVHVPSLFARVGTASVLTVAVGTTMLAPGMVNDAEAATHSTKALKIAASKKGAPYRWGATGPRQFDCSGLTLYAFKKAGGNSPARPSSSTTRHVTSPGHSGNAVTWSSFIPVATSTTSGSTRAAARSGTLPRPGPWSAWRRSGRTTSGTGGSAKGCPVIPGGSARGVRWWGHLPRRSGCGGASQGGGTSAYWMYSDVPTTRRGAVAVVVRPPGITGQHLGRLGPGTLPRASVRLGAAGPRPPGRAPAGERHAAAALDGAGGTRRARPPAEAGATPAVVAAYLRRGRRRRRARAR
ncbi:NlpC/P60 family protein [Streptomyces sp. PpalLS-921]|nr:NlpC/P60 family protein [Streptomyces sp. PpalLS-921]